MPFYVAVESYKFSRMYPLSQRDVIDLSVIPSSSNTANVSLNASAATSALSSPNPQQHVQHLQAGSGLGGCCDTNNTNNTTAFTGGVAATSKIKRSFSDLASALPANVMVEQLSVDFTPAKCITLLFTDLGVLTPAAVSDELIRLYQ